jgi:hypothetical protein
MTRRVTTAREQAEMLSPWRTAADARWVGPLNTPESGKGGRPGKQTIKYPEATQRVIDDVRAATGVKLDVENTGGNTYVLSGRLEDGSWLVAGDGEAGDTWWDQADRHREEDENGPQGWYVGVYHNQVEDNPDGSQNEYWGFDPREGHSIGPFHEHQDMGARTHELPSVVRDTLSSMPHGAKLDPAEPGSTTSPPKPAGSTPKDVDYGDLVNPKQELDDDYGDFGGMLGGGR